MGTIDAGAAARGLLGPQGEPAARFLLFLIPNIGLLGAGLTLGRPRLGGLLMLFCALAWAAAGIFAGRGAVLFAALPFTFVAAGGLVALFAPSRDPVPPAEPPAPAPRRLAPAGPRWTPPRAEPTPKWAGRRLSPAARNEPLLAPRRNPDPRPGPSDEYDDRDDTSPPPEDFIDAVEDFDQPEPDATGNDDAYYDDDIAAEPRDSGEAYGPYDPDDAPDAGESYDADDDAYGPSDAPADPEPEPAPEPEPPPPPPRRRSWSLPEPARRPPNAGEPRYADARQPAPTRREPAPDPFRPARRPPAPEAPPEASFYTAPASRYVPPEPPRFAPPEPRYASDDAPVPRRRNNLRNRRPVETFEDDAEEGDDERRGGPLRAVLRYLVLIAFVLVVVGLAVAVYFDYQRGADSLLFGSRPPANVSSAVEAPADNPPLATAALVDAVPSAAAATAAEAAPEAEPEAEPMLAITYADPFAYCATIATADQPGPEYTGPPVPPGVVSALGLAASAPLDRVRWRCAGRAVFACAATAAAPAACQPTPTVEVMLTYCAAHPDSGLIAAPNGWWSCDGKRPVIPSDQKWPVDARGFFPGAWTMVGSGVTG